MNKLYVIKFVIDHNYVISVYNTFCRCSVEQKMENNPEWKYTLIESNDVHDIYEAR